MAAYQGFHVGRGGRCGSLQEETRLPVEGDGIIDHMVRRQLFPRSVPRYTLDGEKKSLRIL